MDLFEKRPKPFLVSRCLLVERPMNDPEVLKLHMMNRRLIRRYPLYTTVSSLMKQMVMLHEDHQEHLLQMLVSQRVLVFKDWEKKLAAIECLFYDHGIQLAPQPGCVHSCTYKMESDASYNEKPKTATLAAVIWKLGELVDVQVNWGVSCESSGEAESLALLSVLTRGRDLKDKNGENLIIKNVEAVADYKYNCDVLAGIQDVDLNELSVANMAVMQVAKEYDVCIFRWAPRERLPLVDELSRVVYSPRVDLEEVIERHSSKLWGCPIFRINDTDNRKLSKAQFANWASREIVFPKCSYIKAERHTEKLAALLGLLSILDASFVIVLVDSHESAAEIGSSLESYECLTFDLSGKIDEMTSFTDWCDSERAAILLVKGSNIPAFAAKKALVVVFDKPVTPISYSQSQDISGVLTIKFSKDIEQDKEVGPSLYGFFRSYEPHENAQESFNIMTFNLYGKEDGNLRERFFALADVVTEHEPDFICFQSVTPRLHAQLQKYGWWKEYLFCTSATCWRVIQLCDADEQIACHIS